jgi:hypothetical protein
MTITTQMLNTPVDVALTLLCDMADLSFVQLANTYYVTTADRAAKMKADWKERGAQPTAKQLKAAAAKVKTDASNAVSAK